MVFVLSVSTVFTNCSLHKYLPAPPPFTSEDGKGQALPPAEQPAAMDPHSVAAPTARSQQIPLVCTKKARIELNSRQRDTNFLPKGTEGSFQRMPSVGKHVALKSQSPYAQGSEPVTDKELRFGARGPTCPRAPEMRTHLATPAQNHSHPQTPIADAPAQAASHQDAGLRCHLLKSQRRGPSLKVFKSPSLKILHRKEHYFTTMVKAKRSLAGHWAPKENTCDGQ